MSDRQLTGYVDNYYKCNNCREANWVTHPCLFKPAPLVFKPDSFHSDKAKQEIEGLADKRFSSYCRACSMGRTIKRQKGEIGCKTQYLALISDWSNKTGLTYGYNVLKPKDGCPSIPTELGSQLDDNLKLKARIQLLEQERDQQTEKLNEEVGRHNETSHAYDKAHNYNIELLNQISDLQGEVADHKANVSEAPENNQKYIQDIYDRIFGNKTKRNWKSSYWRLERANFKPLFDNLKNLGAKV